MAREQYVIIIQGVRASLRVLLIISEYQEKDRLLGDQVRRQKPLGDLVLYLVLQFFGRASRK